MGDIGTAVPKRSSPCHIGELQVQALIGTAGSSEALAGRMNRNYVNAQQHDFIENQSFLYLSTRDEEGAVWGTVLVGQPGFMKVPHKQLVVVSPLRTFFGDAARLRVGGYVGTLCLELHTRRRNRLNGFIAEMGPDRLVIAVDQAYGNCPKYIQARKIELDAERLPQLGQAPCPVHHGGPHLGALQQELVARADTTFVGSGYEGPGSETARDGQFPKSAGLDMSHRGGPPGFMLVEEAGDGATQLRFADYSGNTLFMTLGNLQVDPRAGLLFIDWGSGDTLQLTGQARILYDEYSLPGAERTLVFKVERWVHVEAALPIQVQGSVDFSPFNPAPMPTRPNFATMAVSKQPSFSSGRLAAEHGPELEALRCISVRQVAATVKTYELEAPRRLKSKQVAQACVASASRSNDPYLPGQYITFDFEDLPGAQARVTNRSWTISSHPSVTQQKSTVTISVKKIGLVSGWLWNELTPGKTLQCRGVDGEFHARLATDLCRPVMIAGGIGITPMRSMWHDFKERRLPTVLMYSVRDLAEAAFLDEFAADAVASQGQMTVHVTVTGSSRPGAESVQPASQQPTGIKDAVVGAAAAAVRGLQLACSSGPDAPADRDGRSADPPFSMPVADPKGYTLHKGRVSTALLMEAAPEVARRAVFLCGPVAFMDSVQELLVDAGCEGKHIHTESFDY